MNMNERILVVESCKYVDKVIPDAPLIITEDYIKPEVGTMLIFPNWLKHAVMPFFGEGERRSMAFNWNVHDSETEMRKYMSPPNTVR